MPDPKNPMEEILKDGQTPPKEEPNEEMETLKESVNTIGENLQSLTEQMQAIDEKLTVQEPETPAPVADEEPPYSGPSGQPVDWKEVRQKAREDAEKITDEKLAEKEKEVEKSRTEEEKARKTINDDFDKQVAEMEKDGLVSAIKDEDDFDDPGRTERRELYGYAAKLGTLRLKEVGETLKREHEHGFAFDNKSGKFIRTKTSGHGKSVPVGSSSARGGGGVKTPIDYKTLHGASMDSLIERSMSE